MTIVTFNTTQLKKTVEFLKEPNKNYSFEELSEIEKSIKTAVFEKLEKIFHGSESPAVQNKILKDVFIPTAFQHNGLIYVLTRDEENALFVDIYVNLARNTLNIYTSSEL